MSNPVEHTRAAETIRDPELYKRLAKPFETAAAELEATNAFHREMRALREKYKIPDVVVLTSTRSKESDEDTVQVVSHGNSQTSLEMIAMAHGARVAPYVRYLTALSNGKEVE